MRDTLSQHDSAAPATRQCVVGLVLTGGTIGAEEDDSVLSVGRDPTRAEAGLLTSQWPAPTTPRIIVRHPIRQLSENLEPTDWERIADAIRDLAEHEQASGVLVFHGTDTMAYTAAALSFLLCDLDIPIVLTGSNLPPDEEGSDASRNVHTALVAMQSLGSGTYVCFAGGSHLPGRVYLGTHVRKLRASGQAFASINRELVGLVEDGEMKPIAPYVREQRARDFAQKIEDRVLSLRLYPGLDLDIAFHAASDGHVRGVVIELYASATGPVATDDRFSLTRFIRRCSQAGIVVVTAIAESPDGNGNVYATTLAIEGAGGRFLHEMLPETATVKMMWALAQSDDPDEIRDLMLRPIAGESGSAHYH